MACDKKIENYLIESHIGMCSNVQKGVIFLKKIAVLLITILLLTGSAYAENVVSPTVPSAVVPSVIIDSITGIDGTFCDGLLIEIQERDDEYASKLTEVVEAAQKLELPLYFGNEAMMKVLGLLPADTDITSAQLDEFFEINVAGYADEYGDVDVSFACVTEYKTDDILLAMIGVECEGMMAWIPLKASVVDGRVIVTFTQEALRMLDGEEATFVLLRFI